MKEALKNVEAAGFACGSATGIAYIAANLLMPGYGQPYEYAYLSTIGLLFVGAVAGLLSQMHEAA